MLAFVSHHQVAALSSQSVTDRGGDARASAATGRVRLSGGKVPQLTDRQKRMLADIDKHFTLDAVRAAYKITDAI